MPARRGQYARPRTLPSTRPERERTSKPSSLTKPKRPSSGCSLSTPSSCTSTTSPICLSEAIGMLPVTAAPMVFFVSSSSDTTSSRTGSTHASPTMPRLRPEERVMTCLSDTCDRLR